MHGLSQTACSFRKRCLLEGEIDTNLVLIVS